MDLDAVEDGQVEIVFRVSPPRLSYITGFWGRAKKYRDPVIVGQVGRMMEGTAIAGP
jgi:hypothetical protein